LIPTVDVVTSDEVTTRPGLLSQQIDVLVPFSQIRSFTHLLSNLDRLEVRILVSLLSCCIINVTITYVQGGLWTAKVGPKIGQQKSA